MQTPSFNPCFNGSMYKNSAGCLQTSGEIVGFNPCFNGSMYKNCYHTGTGKQLDSVSILVLMDLCIKTVKQDILECWNRGFNPCFNGSMYKN